MLDLIEHSSVTIFFLIRLLKMSLSSDSIKLTGDAAYPYMEPPLPIITFSNYDATVITINDSLDGGLICNSDIQ